MQLVFKSGLKINWGMWSDAVLGLMHLAGAYAPWEFHFDVEVKRACDRVGAM